MTPCTACFKSIEANALFCTHCGAAQNAAYSAAAPQLQSPMQNQGNTKQTHLFLSTASTFQVRWTYWVWLALGVSSNFVGSMGYLIGCAIVPYLIVSTFIARKQWQHQQLLDAVKANQRAVPHAATSPQPPAH
jgi:hypothetical protein